MLGASVVATAAGAVLGVVLVVAGATKIAAGPAWPVQAAAMGVPHWLARIVPWVELVAGAAVAVRLVTPWSMLIAVALLTAFTILVIANLIAGRHPPCACFGSWSARPLSWAHVARNAALIALGVVALTA